MVLKHHFSEFRSFNLCTGSDVTGRGSDGTGGGSDGTGRGSDDTGTGSDDTEGSEEGVRWVGGYLLVFMLPVCLFVAGFLLHQLKQT